MFSGKDFTPPVIEEVQINSPADKAGLKKNDIIISIENNKVSSILEVPTYINSSTSNKIIMDVSRNDQILNFLISPNIILTEDNFGNKVKKR